MNKTDITIPPEAVEAAARADFEAWREFHGRSDKWDELELDDQNGYRDAGRSAIRAGLRAWPGMTHAKWRGYGEANRLILPLTENTNAEA